MADNQRQITNNRKRITKNAPPMTYDEAMEYKRNLDPEILAGEDFETAIVVVPADVNDFYQYIQHLPDRKLVDSDAKYYCSNGQYKVNRIKFNEIPPAHSEV